MRLSTLHKNCIQIGIAADPRKKADIDAQLLEEKEHQKKLKGLHKELADEERTWNPYGDSRIIAGSGDEEVKRVMVGIDIETPEVLLAGRLREKGEKIDCLMIHHPEGRALADLYKVVPMQTDLYRGVGVPVNATEAILRPKVSKVMRSTHSKNLFREGRAFELLGFPAFTCHTPTDNLAWRFIDKLVKQKEYGSLGTLINALMSVPEYLHYGKLGNPPIIVSGGLRSRPGKVVVTGFTGGSNVPEAMIAEQAKAGIGTILTMHAQDKEIEEARKHHVNIIQCSHMASDVLGMNLMLDQLGKKGAKLDVLEISGFVRVKR